MANQTELNRTTSEHANYSFETPGAHYSVLQSEGAKLTKQSAYTLGATDAQTVSFGKTDSSHALDFKTMYNLMN